MSENLKIGILLNSIILPAWQYSIIKEIENSCITGLDLLIKKRTDQSKKKKLHSYAGFFLLTLHQKIDGLIFYKTNNYSKNKNISDLIENVTVMAVDTVNDGKYEFIKDEDLKEIKKHNLDIILKFGFGALSGEILKIPKYGIWSFPICGNHDHKEITAGYLEVVEKNPATGSALVVLKDDESKDTVIASSWESTCAYSINLTRNRIFWRASLFIPRIIAGINKYGENYFKSLVTRNKNEEIKALNLPEEPSLGAATRNFFSNILILFRQIGKKIFFSDAFSWALYYKINGQNPSLENNYTTYRKLRPDKDKFWADPFVVYKNERFFVFVEEFIYRKNKGHISVLELDKTGNLMNTQRIIEKSYHMSYPFVFEYNGTFYMIPETSSNNTIDLYKCVSFPDKWEYFKNIMNDIKAVDTTLYYYNNKWWLFTVIDETNNMSGCETELFLFYSDDILSDKWICHPKNPIVADVRSARPAGKIFRHEGKLIRPSQDCSGRYGNAFILNHILNLSETEYEESPVSRVNPDWDTNLRGTHTYNFDQNFTIIDAYSFRKRPIMRV